MRTSRQAAPAGSLQVEAPAVRGARPFTYEGGALEPLLSLGLLLLVLREQGPAAEQSSSRRAAVVGAQS
ncbi:hypothetical protein ACWEIM_05965 [Streptomyces sp. NPDC004778]